jgi:hypothetical protein
MLHYFRREEQAVREWAEEDITLSTEYGFLGIVAKVAQI